jgi:hypothetical protein
MGLQQWSDFESTLYLFLGHYKHYSPSISLQIRDRAVTFHSQARPPPKPPSYGSVLVNLGQEPYRGPLDLVTLLPSSLDLHSIATAPAKCRIFCSAFSYRVLYISFFAYMSTWFWAAASLLSTSSKREGLRTQDYVIYRLRLYFVLDPCPIIQHTTRL